MLPFSPASAGTSPLPGSHRAVGEVQDPVAVGLRPGEGELDFWAAVAEQPLTGTVCQRVDKKVQLVDQAVGEHRPDQGAAAADVDIAVQPVLERTNRARA